MAIQEHDDAKLVEGLCERAQRLEVALHGLVLESLDRDNRGPQPALEHAIEVLGCPTRDYGLIASGGEERPDRSLMGRDVL